jgi:hypothetical protein
MTGSLRRVLVVGRDYFFYTRAICDMIAARTGAAVAFVPIEPAGVPYKLAKRAGAPGARWLDRHHRRAIARHSGFAPDLLLFIQCHQLADRLAWYRDAFPGVPFRLYYWDSIRTHDYRPWLPFFETAFSFDPEDCAAVPGLQHLPLFFVPELRAARTAQDPPFDLGFVGTAVSRRRYDALEALRQQAAAQGLTLDAELVVSPLFWLRELFAGRPLRRVRFRSVGRDEVLARYARAAAILDVPNNSQSGLTMRTFETLGAHRKLVTTNARVASAGFFDPDVIAVLEKGQQLPPRAWLRDGRTPGPGIEAFGLEAWVDRLLAPGAAVAPAPATLKVP